MHQQPFYGVPSHKPLRPAVFAGREFRIPSVLDASLFTCHANASALTAAGAASALAMLRTVVRQLPLPQPRQRGAQPSWGPAAATMRGVAQRYRGVYAFRPPCKPPSREATELWLAQRRGRRGSSRRSAGDGGGGARASAAESGRGGAAAGPGAAAAAGFVMDPNTGQLIPGVRRKHVHT